MIPVLEESDADITNSHLRQNDVVWGFKNYRSLV
jgi:hypothetical protein